MSSIVAAEPLVAEQIRKFFGWMAKKESTPMNVYARFRMLSLDIVSVAGRPCFGVNRAGR